MTTLLTLKNLTLTHPHKQIFSDVTFTLNQGDKIGVLGLNGHGKTSLFKVIAGSVTPDTTVPPFIYDKNKDFTFFYVPQELPDLNNWTIEDYFYLFYPMSWKLKIELNSINHKIETGVGDLDALLEKQSHIFDQLEHLGDNKNYDKYLNYLSMFEVTNLNRSMKTLSGGEQRKVSLSLGLSAPQELILWDEPTNHLDVETIEMFEDELMNSSKTIMIISHDRSLLTNVVDRIIHIQRGKLRSFSGTYGAYLEFLQSEQLRRDKELDKLSNIQRRETAWIRRGAKARRTKSKKRIEDYGTLNKAIQNLKEQAHKSVSLNLKSSGRKSKILIQGKEITHSFGDKVLFKGINFSLNQGDKVALCGSNGVGKTTLLKILMEQIKPAEGSIHQVEGLTIGYYSQNREALDLNQSPWQLIGEGIDFVMSNTGEKRHVASYLEQFLFSSEEIKRPIATFSGGEKNRLQLAQFMKHAKDLWIFDEPTNDLDLETIGILEEELKNYPGALIIVGHDRSFLSNVTDKCWILNNGELENFEAGFEQAQEYLEALALEKQLKKKNSVSRVETPSSVVKGLSQKEKLRLEVLTKELANLEHDIAKQEAALQQVDYSDRSAANLAQIQQTQTMLNQNKKNYQELMQEWLALEEKNE